MPSEIRKILYIRTDRMGDVLMNLPAIHLLRQTYPKSWITLLADKSVAPLFQDQPDLDEVYPIDPRKFEQSAAYRGRLRKDLARAKFDAVIISNADKHLHWLAFRAGIPTRVGWSRKWGFLLTHRLPDDKHVALRHEIDSNLLLVSLVSDQTWDGRMMLVPQKGSVDKMTRLIGVHPHTYASFVVLHTGTSRKEKRWGADSFEALANSIVRNLRRGVIFIGDEEESEAAERIVSRLDRGSAISLAGLTTLQDLVALFSMPAVEAMVSCDSGPLHVAWILSKPVVGLYAANVAGSDPRRWGPKYTRSRELFKPMAEITVDEVEAALDDVLRGSR